MILTQLVVNILASIPGNKRPNIELLRLLVLLLLVFITEVALGKRDYDFIYLLNMFHDF